MKKSFAFIIIGLISGLVVFLIYRQSIPFFQHIDNRLKDNRFVLRGPVKPTSKVVVIAIDDKSIRELGQWPWPRATLGKLVKNLSNYGVKVTALDIVFSEPDSRGEDSIFAKDIAAAGNVVLGYFFRDEVQSTSQQSLAQIESAKLKLIKLAPDVSAVPIIEYSSVTANIPVLGAGASDFGYFNQTPDSDGVFRRSPLLLLYSGDIYPSLSIKALRYLYGSDPMLSVAAFGVDSLSIGKHIFPINERGFLTLNYYGPTGSFRTISAVDVINNKLNKSDLEGCIAFVGATEIGIYDVRNTPFDSALPGVEIHATVAANSIDNRFIIRDGRTAGIEIAAIILTPVLLAILLSLVPGTMAGLAVLGVITALAITVNQQLFSRYLFDITILYPLLSIGIAQLTSESYRNLVVERKGRTLKKAFSSYVSPDLVKQIEKDPDKLVLGGEQREISILFSDIRGFTTISEGLSPQELVRLLNEYLNPMTRIVLEEKGTLDKFIGDAVMAIFNAPLDLSNHQDASCRAAVRMIEALSELNKNFSSQGMHTIDIGIGINTGPAVVGNMGADIRFDYTAIGDSVNLSSRLEGLNKYYGTHILVSDDTKRGVTSTDFKFREVDRVRVKGKTLPVIIYELMAGDTSHFSSFEAALALYRKAEFAAASKLFDQLVKTVNDGPSLLYLERCKEYIQDPPSEDWDGVYTAKSK